MKSVATGTIGILLSLLASGAFACSFARPDPFGDLMRDIFKNRRVDQAADCSFVNGGSYDSGEGAAAVDHGAGRVSQSFSSTRMMLLDCNAMEVVLVYGRPIPGTETDCSRDYVLEPLISPKGSLNLAHGADLDEFALHAESLDVFVDVEFDLERIQGSGKDRVDILCGCKVFYPDSVGGQS